MVAREEYDPRQPPRVMLADIFAGKEDEEAQKTFHARRKQISQEKNLSLSTDSSLTQRKRGHYSRPYRRYSNRERRGHGSVEVLDLSTKVDMTELAEGSITENIVVLDTSREAFPREITTVPENKMQKGTSTGIIQSAAVGGKVHVTKEGHSLYYHRIL